ncbi:bile acid:sodium symporter [Aestuariirhabdus sp. LZHN29]|uniref:bile acid:sodium symporter n=1 Tax=Aestuariirhabdus sp. LZHN29 TaxID=3417462 RepID=UPI003CF298C2
MPIGLLLAFVGALLVPGPGQWLEQQGAVRWMVVIIFLLNGYQTRLQGVPTVAGYGRLIVLAVVINLLLAPWLGWLVVNLLPLSLAVSIGVLVMAVVPPTLSSGIVMTRMAGGDGAAALVITVLLNLLGVFSIPLLLSWTMGRAGLVEVSPWPLLQSLALLVLVPFVLGMALRRWRELPVPTALLAYVPSLCVIGTAWMLMSRSQQTLLAVAPLEMLWAAMASLLVHAALLGLCYGVGNRWISDKGRQVALLFTASQKTLPVAISVMAAMAIGAEAGIALLCCILFHFLQLLVDSMLASRLSRR